jgi:hypothetical protein
MHISKELDKLLGNGDVVLGNLHQAKPSFLCWHDSAQESSSIPRWNPVPLADMFKFASLVRLGTLLVIEAKETAVFLD